jgi:3-oxoacyl-[acyl-carrier-protein] synthase II
MFSPLPERRVAVTGLGLVSPAGGDLQCFFEALYAGQSFIKPLRGFSIAELPGLVGGEADLDEREGGAPDEVERAGDMASYAARRAVVDARLMLQSASLRDACVVLGTTLGEERRLGADSERRAAAEAGTTARGNLIELADNHRLAARVAQDVGASGQVWMNATACSSGNAALAWGYDLIASGAAEIVLAGGVDTLTRLTYCGFRRMGALSKTFLKPFHRDRDGVSFGEGAGILVLESLDHAQRRGARIRAELLGFGISNDAYHLTAPEPSGDGFVRAARQALLTCEIDPEQIDYVSAHGTGTVYNDAGEVAAMKSLFGARAPAVPISSIKSMLGHTNGAASAIEAIACVLMLERQALLPTANLTQPDPAFGLDFVPLQGRAAKLGICLNMAAGFGGFNVCTVIKGAP